MAPLSHDDYVSLRRFDALDGLRAISILLVFAAHPVDQSIWSWTHGATGVTLFFVLSGFLITTLLAREHERYGRVNFAAFYIRRLFRIYPMYFAVFAMYCVLILVAGLQPERRAAFVDNIPAFIFFFPERTQFFNHTGVAVPFDGSWSIGIEEKFYAVWPLLGFAVLGGVTLRRARVPSLLGIAMLCSALSLGCSWGVVLEPYTPIALGAAAGLLLHDQRSYRRLEVLGRGPVLGAFVCVALVLQFGTREVMIGGYLYHVYALALTLVLIGVVVSREASTGWLTSRPLVYLGELSYVLYLIHNFGLNFAEMVVPGGGFGLLSSILATVAGIGGSIFAAHFIHKWFEDPIRRWGARLAAGRRRPSDTQAVGTGEH